jgi:integrase/recombinase XerD
VTFASCAMKQAKTLKNEELKLVLTYITVRRHAARNRAIILASFLSGMRAHELASLKIGDVVDEDGRIRNEIVLTAEQTKGRRARRVTLTLAKLM